MSVPESSPASARPVRGPTRVLAAFDAHPDLIAPLVIAVGFALRLHAGMDKWLNPDEAANLQTALLPTLRAVLADVWPSPHPPVFFVIVHLWSRLGSSDLMLRLPSILAGTAALWFFYRWLRLRFTPAVGLAGLVLLACAPEVIAVSAEVRQYGLLFLFMTADLYLLELALRDRSPARMLGAGLLGMLALATHYSALIFLLVVGAFGLIAVITLRSRPTLLGWIAAQALTAGLGFLFYLVQLAKLKGGAMEGYAREGWLKASYFHPASETLGEFAFRQSLAVFRHLFSNPVIGRLMVLVFIAGFLLLVVRALRRRGEAGRAAGDIVLLLLPFAVAIGAAAAGLFPYGGTRHTICLAVFAFTGIGIILAAGARHRLGILLLTAIVLVPLWHRAYVPPSQWLAPRDQAAHHLREWLDYLRQLTPPATDTLKLSPAQRRVAGLVFTDGQTQGLLRHYLGNRRPPVVRNLAYGREIGFTGYRAVYANPWNAEADSFGVEFKRLARSCGLETGDTVTVAVGGWGYNLADQFKTRYNLSFPGLKRFGANLSVFRVVVGREPTPDRLAAGRGTVGEILADAARLLARNPPPEIRSVFWPTEYLDDSTYTLTRPLSDHTVSYYELYQSVLDDMSRFNRYLPALAFWTTRGDERHPMPMRYMRDFESYLSGGYRFTLLTMDPDSTVAVYEIRPAQ